MTCHVITSAPNALANANVERARADVRRPSAGVITLLTRCAVGAIKRQAPHRPGPIVDRQPNWAGRTATVEKIDGGARGLLTSRAGVPRGGPPSHPPLRPLGPLQTQYTEYTAENHCISHLAIVVVSCKKAHRHVCARENN